VERIFFFWLEQGVIMLDYITLPISHHANSKSRRGYNIGKKELEIKGKRSEM
jgi:hypothetical protein